MKQSGFGRQHQIASLRLQGQASAADAGDAPIDVPLSVVKRTWIK
jgi:hypothetical protein